MDVLDKTFLNDKNNNLYYQLYNAIEKGMVNTDEDAGKLLYGTGKNDPRYRMLKSRLKDKVLKSAMMLNLEKSFNNAYGRTYINSIYNNNVIEVLVHLSGTTKLIYNLIKEDYAVALKFKYYDILINYSYLLLVYYSLNGKHKMFKEEENNFFKYLDLSQKDRIARYLYFKIIVNFVRKAPITDEFMKSFKQDLDKLYLYKTELQNFAVDFQYYYLAFVYYDYTNEANALLRICNESEDKMFKIKDSITNNRKVITLIYKLKAYIKLKRYRIAKNCLNSFDDKYLLHDNSQNWFVLKETEFILFLQCKDVEEANNIYAQVLASKSYKRKSAILTEKWKIYHAYLVFLDNYLHKGDFKKFSLPKFLNSVPVNSKDKSGFNFAIRVIELMYLLARRQLVQVYNKMDALRVYRSRYLKDITYKRNHLFLSLLLKAEKFGFDGRLLQKADWQEIQDLRDRKHIIAEWEIIPYEELWDIFVDLSKK
ncbi:MAG: hypothetical protein U0T77_07900 [Chitinophagales bacterium]